MNGARPEAQQRAVVDLGAVPGQPVRPRREQQPEPALPASGCGEPLASLAGRHNRPWQRGWMGAGRAAFAEEDAGHRSPRRVLRHRAARAASEYRRSGERHADEACSMPHVRLDVRPGDVVAPSRPRCRRTADGVRLAKAPRTRGRAQFIRKAAGESGCQCGYSANPGITPGPAILCTADILNPLSTTCAYYDHRVGGSRLTATPLGSQPLCGSPGLKRALSFSSFHAFCGARCIRRLQELPADRGWCARRRSTRRSGRLARPNSRAGR